MNLLGNPILWSVVIGVLGAGSRILLQLANPEYEPSEKENQRRLALIGLGAVGGWLALLIVGFNQIAIWALGFVASDVIENIASAYNPHQG